MYTINFWIGVGFVGFLWFMLIAWFLLIPVIWPDQQETYYAKARSRSGDRWGIRLIGFVAMLVLAVITFIGFFPFEKEYHAYMPIGGTVAEVSSRLLPSGDAMEQKFVIRFEGSQQEYGCNDTRCALVEPGDRLTLKCIREWEYNGSDGYNCKFGKNDGAIE